MEFFVNWCVNFNTVPKCIFAVLSFVEFQEKRARQTGTVARHNVKNESKIGQIRPGFKRTVHKGYNASPHIARQHGDGPLDVSRGV